MSSDGKICSFTFTVTNETRRKVFEKKIHTYVHIKQHAPKQPMGQQKLKREMKNIWNKHNEHTHIKMYGLQKKQFKGTFRVITFSIRKKEISQKKSPNFTHQRNRKRRKN